jgi:2-oxoglutarate dehydrogenase E1 component
VVWVQEEPENMGAWWWWQVHVRPKLPNPLRVAGLFRAESASPAIGSKYLHRQQQQALLREAFGEHERALMTLTSKEIVS